MTSWTSSSRLQTGIIISEGADKVCHDAKVVPEMCKVREKVVRGMCILKEKVVPEMCINK